MKLRCEIFLRSIDRPFHKSYRTLGRPVTVPLELRVAVTYKCPNRCRECHCWKRSLIKDMRADEYGEFFGALGFSPFAITFTGGEPYIREDIFGIISSACEKVSPAIVTIETCGDFPDEAAGTAILLAREFPETLFVTRLSISGTGEMLGRMRGEAPDSFELFLRSFTALRAICAPNSLTCINVLISKKNAHAGLKLVDEAFMLYPDMVSLEFAGGSSALGVSAEETAPDAETIKKILFHYRKRLGGVTGDRPARFFNRMIPGGVAASARASARGGGRHRCYSGFSSIYIDPEGKVMDCPVAGRELGDLRLSGYNLGLVLDSPTAARARRISAKCAIPCSMSCQSMSAVFLSARGYASLAWTFI